jgi:hypothetical protein
MGGSGTARATEQTARRILSPKVPITTASAEKGLRTVGPLNGTFQWAGPAREIVLDAEIPHGRGRGVTHLDDL